jgi:hypothetical protein
MSAVVYKLALCDRPPYATFDAATGVYAGAWLHVVTDIFAARNATTALVMPDSAECDMDPHGTLIAALASGLADVALYPFMYNFTYPRSAGLVSSYPIENGSPILVTSRPALTAESIFVAPFRIDAWFLVSGIFVLSVAAAAFVDRKGGRGRHLPRVLLSFCGSVDLPEDTSVPVYLMYSWLAFLSLVLNTVYSSVMAQLLLLNEFPSDAFAETLAKGDVISVTSDIQQQLPLSRSPFTLQLDSNHTGVAEKDAIFNLPVVTSWPVSSMMRQLSCDDLDLSYQEISKVSYSILSRSEVPAWLYGDVQEAVYSRRFPTEVQAFVTAPRPFCGDPDRFIPEVRQTALPVLGVGLGSLVLAVIFVTVKWFGKRSAGLLLRRSMRSIFSLSRYEDGAAPQEV